AHRPPLRSRNARIGGQHGVTAYSRIVMTQPGDPSSLPSLDQLELRGLVAELTQRVEGIASLADRLQGLLHAVVAIGSQLELDEVLHRIVTTAADLVDAEYAALGVLDPSGER